MQEERKILRKLQTHKRAIARHFSKAAQTYNEAACLEKEVGGRLLERLEYIKQDPKTILDLGGGSSFFSRSLAIRYPKATVFNLDLAEGMLSYSKTYSQDDSVNSRIITLCGDAEALPLSNNSMDFIFSNCVFHWCCDISKLFQEIHRVLKPEGFLLFSTLGPDTLKELRDCFYRIDSNLHVNHFMDMHLVGDALLQTQFLDPVMDMEQLVFTFSNLSHLIEDIRKSGASYVFRETAMGLSSKHLYKKLLNHYNEYKLESGEIPATVEVVYGHAWSNSKKTFLRLNSTERENGYYRIPISEIRHL